MRYKITEIIKTNAILLVFLNSFITVARGLKYIEPLYIFLFLGCNLFILIYKGYLEMKVKEKLCTVYTMKRKIVNSRRRLLLSCIILPCFYIFKEPYFYLSKRKILILIIATIVEFMFLILAQRIKIKVSLVFLKEILIIFIVSGIMYYLPIIFFENFFEIPNITALGIFLLQI